MPSQRVQLCLANPDEHGCQPVASAVPLPSDVYEMLELGCGHFATVPKVLPCPAPAGHGEQQVRSHVSESNGISMYRLECLCVTVIDERAATIDGSDS